MSVQLLGKRELKRLASVANDGAASGYSGFAKGMMAKMGWAEGQGLGKDEQGRSTYVQVKKKDDNAGLGKEKAHQNNVNDQWYFDAFDSALANMGGEKKKKKKKEKNDKKKRKKGKAGEGEEQPEEGGSSMYDKMFKATGGARMGMRARASQNGKLARTEGCADGCADATPPTTVTPQEAQQSGNHKRKRAAAYSDGAAAAQALAGVDGVVVEQKAPSEAAKTVVKQEWGGESEEPRTSSKAERKRERSEAKKAKKAGKAVKVKEEKATTEPSGGEGSGEARPEKEEKARKKKKKRGGEASK
eukprot:g7941.t1